MNSRFLYLAINIVSVTVPLLFSFYGDKPFYKKWKYLWLSTLLTTIIFVMWDIAFVHLGVWGFNPKYVLGVYVFNLPLEEVLFFICIPYACIFTYEALNYLIEKDYLKPYHEIISSGLVIILFINGTFYLNQLYTSVTFLGLAFFIAFVLLKVRPYYMGRFYFSFIVILIPFFIVNGILTGSFIKEEVVWYNDQENIGLRLGTIPFEDIFYGMLMILINIVIFEWLQISTIYKVKNSPSRFSRQL